MRTSDCHGVLTLFIPSGLTKYGNNDGDRPYSLDGLFDESPVGDGLAATMDSERRWSGDWHAVLFDLYENLVAPLLPDGYTLYKMETCHNPCRVKFNGEYDDEPEIGDFAIAVNADTLREYCLRHGTVQR